MKKYKRILYVSPSRFPTEKAQGYQTAKMCEAFARNNEVLLLYPNRWNLKNMKGIKDIYKYYRVKKNFYIRKLFCLDLVLLRKMKMFKLWYFIHSFSYSIRIVLWILFKRKRFDIIYSRDQFTVFFLSFINKLVKAKLVYEIHLYHEKLLPVRSKMINKCDKCVVMTNKLKDRYERAGVNIDRILVEPDAVDLDHFNVRVSKRAARERLNIPEELKIASFVGRFHTMGMEKGIPDIIRSAKSIFNLFSDFYFYFLGGPMEREKIYRNLITWCGLAQNRFVFCEKQSVKILPLWLKASDILLMPHPCNKYYAFAVSPLKMFEYMASRRPIIGTRLPAIEEILTHGKNALLGEPGNPKVLAENIINLLRNPQLGINLAEEAFRLVKTYTWCRRSERILDSIQ